MVGNECMDVCRSVYCRGSMRKHMCVCILVLHVCLWWGGWGRELTAFPSSVLSPLLQSLFRGVLRYNHCSRELKKVDDTHRHMLMGWKRHFKGNVCVLEI